MIDQINKVKKFHEAFGIVNNSEPTNLTFDEFNLRAQLLEEELQEYAEAAAEGDLVEIADALGDQLYIVFGTILRHGMGNIIVEVFNEIQRSNMSKLDENGEAIINGVNGADPTKPMGKILKSEQYSEPDIKSILDKYSELPKTCKCGKEFSDLDMQMRDSRPKDKCVACFTSNA